MFTGLIEDVGKMHSKRIRGGSGKITVSTRLPLREVKIGSSVAVNGACLTVVKKGKSQFMVDVSPETLDRTNLGEMKPGDCLNLERPLQLSGRLGGHLVSGHVDAVGKISKIHKKGQFTFFVFEVPPRLTPLLVPKGSVAIDGISLTVNERRGKRISVAIIPFTLKNTNLQHRRLGDKVNIEADLVGKYVQSFLTGRKS